MVRMSAHTGLISPYQLLIIAACTNTGTQALSAPISSLSLLLVQTQAARWKAATPDQLTGTHLYLNIA